MQLALAAIFCVTVALLVYSTLESVRAKKAIRRRLAHMESGGDGISLEEIEMSRSFSERVILPVFTRLGSLLGSATPDRFLKRAAQRLARSGFHRTDPRVYIGTKVMLALTCAAVFIVLGGYAKLTGSRGLAPFSQNLVPCLMLFPGMCYTLPDLWLRIRDSRRRQDVGCALPDLLDLLTVSVEAGLGFEQALLHAAEKMKGAMSDEIKRLLQDMRIGMKHSEAFRALADRVNLPDLRTFCAALIQADQLGVSIAEVLRVQADSMRVKRRQRAEEAALKAPLKLLFPLVLFVFPALFIILLGPAVINIILNMKGAM